MSFLLFVLSYCKVLSILSIIIFLLAIIMFFCDIKSNGIRSSKNINSLERLMSSIRIFAMIHGIWLFVYLMYFNDKMIINDYVTTLLFALCAITFFIIIGSITYKVQNCFLKIIDINNEV